MAMKSNTYVIVDYFIKCKKGKGRPQVPKITIVLFSFRLS